MKYLHYIWRTDLKKLPVKDKIIGLGLFMILPYTALIGGLSWVAMSINEWPVIAAVGFIAGYYLRGILEATTYAFGLKED